MGFFDALTMVKDIVQGGIASYKASEKLDELIEKSKADYDDALTDEEKSLLQQYYEDKKNYDDNQSEVDGDTRNELIEKLEDSRVEYLEALTKNSSLPKSFRNEIKDSIAEFKKADNMALEKVGDTLMKAAKTDEEREKVKDTLGEFKRK